MAIYKGMHLYMLKFMVQFNIIVMSFDLKVFYLEVCHMIVDSIMVYGKT